MQSKILVKQILLSTNYWSLNKDIVKMFGLESAFILSNLAEAENMMADEDGWFYQTGDKLEKISGLSRYKQDRAIDEFVEAGILEKELRGIPAKRYFRFNNEKLVNKISKNLKTSVKKYSKLDLKEFETNKESTINKVNKESIKDHSPAKAEPQIPYKEIVDYLNKKTGRNYKHSTNKTKELIKARWNEDFELEDFKKAIDVKVAEWIDTDMEQYLRPVTLFGTKFESYLNQPVQSNNSKGDWSEWDFLD